MQHYKSRYSDVTQPPAFLRGGWAPPNYGSLKLAPIIDTARVLLVNVGLALVSVPDPEGLGRRLGSLRLVPIITPCVRMRSRGRVFGLSVCLFVCLSVCPPLFGLFVR